MNLTKYLARFDRLHHLIRKKATGSPAELALKLGLSERAVFEYIRAMRDMGAPISFCAYRRTYYYEHEVQFNVGFRDLSEEETSVIDGGMIVGAANYLRFFDTAIIVQ